MSANDDWQAPEMYVRSVRSRAVDVYSFAILMWEVMTRRRPYEGFAEGETLSVRPAPPRLGALLALLTPNPHEDNRR